MTTPLPLSGLMMKIELSFRRHFNILNSSSEKMNRGGVCQLSVNYEDRVVVLKTF